jgi:hypothetical protein
MTIGRLLWALLLGHVAIVTGAQTDPARLENAVLRIELSTADASLRVLDKRDNLTFRQDVRPGYRVDPGSIRITSSSLSGRVSSANGPLSLTIDLPPGTEPGFALKIESNNLRYVAAPEYPFHFLAPGANWSYVQNTSGEGLLLPLDGSTKIREPYTWSGSQPWWGLTDLIHGLAVRLDSFCNPLSHGGRDTGPVYALPMQINYRFFDRGGYVALAKSYREYFLRTHPELRPLSERIAKRPAIGNLKDGVYVYLWGENPSDDLKLVTEMKSAGIDRGVAVFYGKHPIDRALFDGIKRLGWIAGSYHMPTGNLFRVGRRGWPNAVLTGKIKPDQLLRQSNPKSWDRVCGKYQLGLWLQKARGLIQTYGTQLFYFDTLVVQLAPCLNPRHPSTIEENQAARLAILEKTQELGMVTGSGEGLCPTWSLPGVDFFEGLMSLRTYADPKLRIPAGGYKTELGESYAADAAVILDERTRIPLYQLGFHDYVAGSWVWRDTNFQSRPYAWKKDLFNILYGTMPMWHLDRRLWESHKEDYVASYRAIASVRARIGFAGMIGHGWLTNDRSVQYSDWDTGDRVIVNFGRKPFERPGKEPVKAASFVLEGKDVP